MDTIELNYFMVLTLLMIMVSIHNLIKSILFYRADNLKVSNIIKIILNSSGLACGISSIGLLLTINNTSTSECLTITYLRVLTNFAFTESIIIFLVWKLRQFSNSKIDDYIVYGLLSIRSLFYIIFIAFVRPQVTFHNISSDITWCDIESTRGRCFMLITTITDLLIDVYVASRIIQSILLRFSTTSQNESQQQYQRSCSLFILFKLILLNSLPILMASLQHINMNMLAFKLSIVSYMIKTVIFIILSYVITLIGDSAPEDHMDKTDIESGNSENHKKRVIPKLTLSNLKEPPVSNEDVVLRVSNGMLANMPLKDARDEIKMEQQYKIKKLDPDGEVGFLKQSLSFYEVISMILGNEKNGKEDKGQS
ncbi:hypothetical protein GLOIN_2v1765916 [Rhizophagus clarus]|uniref:Uncharacterized protein n=2 Tax=Rhizophagus clarus TaxID=94130 RepID=A0A8H3QEY3_9GLOM|nr:hypothetical protein GLOIN_2v1765916 [Rhizophagus clarus]